MEGLVYVQLSKLKIFSDSEIGKNIFSDCRWRGGRKEQHSVS
jgi:hypothetical protein